MPCKIPACLLTQLAAVEDAKMADTGVVQTGSIGLKPSAALAPGADTGGINMSPVPLTRVVVHLIYNSSHSGRVLSGKAPRRVG